MKKEQRLIIKLLDSLAAEHGEMSFVYGYDGFLDQHIVEVAPLEKFEDEKYLLDEGRMLAEFIASYPDKGLMFICDDPYIKVENPVYQIKSESGKSVSKLKILTPKSFRGNWGRRSQH